jgi:hypothetical protein
VNALAFDLVLYHRFDLWLILAAMDCRNQVVDV